MRRLYTFNFPGAGDVEACLSASGRPASSTADPPAFGKCGALFPTEDRKAYERHHKRLWDELRPEGFLQEKVADRIIWLTWRLENLHIFPDAQAARKEYRPFLRDTIVETMLVYQNYSKEVTKKQFEAIMKRTSKSVDEQGKSDEVSLKADESARQEGKETIKTSDNVDVVQLNDAFQSMMSALENVLGPEGIDKVAQGRLNGTPLELAFLADAVTIENCLEELALATALERAIDENLERLRNLKENRCNSWEPSKRRSRLLPPYD